MYPTPVPLWCYISTITPSNRKVRPPRANSFAPPHGRLLDIAPVPPASGSDAVAEGVGALASPGNAPPWGLWLGLPGGESRRAPQGIFVGCGDVKLEEKCVGSILKVSLKNQQLPGDPHGSQLSFAQEEAILLAWVWMVWFQVSSKWCVSLLLSLLEFMPPVYALCI